MSQRVFVEVDADMRRRIEALIESLISICDQLDGLVEDLEPQGDEEPSEAPIHSRGGNGTAPITRIY